MAQFTSYVSERRKKRQKIRLYVFSAVAILLLYFIFDGVAWLILRAPFFRATNIVIQGNNTVPSGDIMNLLEAAVINHGDEVSATHSPFSALLGFHNMMVWPDALPQDDLALIPGLADISITKDYWSHTVTVNATEREPFGIWCFEGNTAGEQCYWYDSSGIIFEKAFDTQGSAISVVHDYSQKPQGLNQEILPDEFVPNLISIINVLHQTGLTISALALNDISLQQIDVTTVNGPVLHFSLRFPADDDLPVIQSLMGQKGFSKLQYIDATTQNRLYYK